MNPWILLGALVTLIGVGGGAYWQGRQDGRDSQLAEAARDSVVAAIASEAAASAAAEAISRIEVKNVVVRQPLETIVRTEQVFRDCRSGDDARRLLNATPAIARESASAAGNGQLPGTGAAR